MTYYVSRGTLSNCSLTHSHISLYTIVLHNTTTTLPPHPFNGLFSRTTWVSQHQKGKPFWILLEQEMMGWQWHQLDHMQIICTLLRTDNDASTPPLSFYRPDALPDTKQQRQSTEGVVHNTAQNSSDNLPSYPPDNHHCSNVGLMKGMG